MIGGQAECGKQIGGAWTLDGEHCEVEMEIAHLDPIGSGGRKPADDFGGVGRVRHEEHVVIGAQVDDQVVDDTA